MTLTATPVNQSTASSFPPDQLMSALMRLNLQPLSSQRTLIQALELLCEAFEVTYGLLGRLDTTHEVLETVTVYGANGWADHEESLKHAAIQAMLTQADGVIPTQFSHRPLHSDLEFKGCGIPIIWRGELIGLLILLCPKKRPHDIFPHLEIMLEAAGYFSLVMVNQILSAQADWATAAPTTPTKAQANALKTELRNFSHDLRNVLSAILACSDLLVNHRAMISPSNLNQLFDTLYRSTEEAVNLLNLLQDHIQEKI